MITLLVNCIGQTMEIANDDDVTLVSGSKGIYDIVFNMDDEWTNFAVSAVFLSDVYKRRVLSDLNGNTCLIPDDVLEQPGELYIGLVGTGGKERMPTIKKPKKTVVQGIDIPSNLYEEEDE